MYSQIFYIFTIKIYTCQAWTTCIILPAVTPTTNALNCAWDHFATVWIGVLNVGIDVAIFTQQHCFYSCGRSLSVWSYWVISFDHLCCTTQWQPLYKNLLHGRCLSIHILSINHDRDRRYSLILQEVQKRPMLYRHFITETTLEGGLKLLPTRL